MKDSRIRKTNYKENEHLYSAHHFNSKHEHIYGDCYILACRPIGNTKKFRESGNFLRYFLSDEPLPQCRQHAIIFKKSGIREIFEKVDWEKAYIKHLSWDYVGKEEIRRAFNEAVALCKI